MNKTELESKHIAELHALAAEAGVERYRMLGRTELIEKLAGAGGGGGSESSSSRRSDSGRRRRSREERPRGERPRERREEKARDEKPSGEGRQRRPDDSRGGRGRGGPREGGRRSEPREGSRRDEPRDDGGRQQQPRSRRSEEQAPPVPPSSEPTAAAPAGERPKRRRRRRRWGRRPKGLRVHDLLLPVAGGRQSIVYAETRETCTALLREVAGQLSDASKGPDPIALLIDPSPEELAEWRRDAPQAEIVAAGKANHADDAIAQAVRRAEGGENVIVLIDSLSRFAETYGDAEGARGLLDAALTASQSAAGSLTVVAALERPH